DTLNDTSETACTAATRRCMTAPAVTGYSLTRLRSSSRGGASPLVEAELTAGAGGRSVTPMRSPLTTGMPCAGVTAGSSEGSDKGSGTGAAAAAGTGASGTNSGTGASGTNPGSAVGAARPVLSASGPP